jgi:hypothetical protein
MKRNLLALLAVLVMVAVAARLGKDPDKAALEADLRVCLEKLWGTSNQQVELVGSTLHVKVGLPKQGRVEWSDPFVRFVAARHPRVEVKEFDISPGPGRTYPAGVELLKRQTQALVDATLGSGRGLILIDGLEESPQAGSNRPTTQRARQARPDDRSSAGAPALEVESYTGPAPFFPSKPRISEQCLVVGPEPTDEQLQKLQAQLQVQTDCHQFRIVRLPAL